MGVARRLGWAPLTYTIKIAELDPAAKTIKAERLLEQGKQIVTSTLPAVIGTVKDINEPRYPSFMGIRKAPRPPSPPGPRPTLGWTPAKWARPARPPLAHASPLPAREGSVEMIDGTPEEIAAKLADKLLADKVI